MIGFDPTQLIKDPRLLDLLRQIQQSGITRGAEILSRVSLKPDELQSLLRELAKIDLITVSGSLNSAQDALLSYISVPPSASGVVRQLLSKPM